VARLPVLRSFDSAYNGAFGGVLGDLARLARQRRLMRHLGRRLLLRRLPLRCRLGFFGFLGGLPLCLPRDLPMAHALGRPKERRTGSGGTRAAWPGALVSALGGALCSQSCLRYERHLLHCRRRWHPRHYRCRRRTSVVLSVWCRTNVVLSVWCHPRAGNSDLGALAQKATRVVVGALAQRAVSERHCRLGR
jgi:hypothetical protein